MHYTYIITKSRGTNAIIIGHNELNWCEVLLREKTNQLSVPVSRSRLQPTVLLPTTTFKLACYKYSTLVCQQLSLATLLYPSVISHDTYLDTVWAQFWRPAFALSQKYRRVGGGPRTHWPLSTHPSLHIRTILRDSRFHCHSTRRPGASRSHGTHQHRRFNSTAATAAVEWTTRASVGARGETAEDRNCEARGRCDLHARERESRQSLNGGRCAARNAAQCGESCTRRRAWLAAADWRARRDEPRLTTTRAPAHTRTAPTSRHRAALHRHTAPPTHHTRSKHILKFHTQFDFKISSSPSKTRASLSTWILTWTKALRCPTGRIGCAVNGQRV